MRKLVYFLLAVLGLTFSFTACEETSSTANTKNMSGYYVEEHRPQFHFSPPQQWMNDPNGMVYYDGEYHLFYQHYPEDNVWGPMHWGHAVSKDLMHWENLPIALYPDSLGYIFSGSAVVDHQNTSGFGENGKPALIAIYTYHDPVGEKNGSNVFQTQGIAYSNDKGRTWTKYEGNPVIPNPGIRDFRDPKVSWHEESQQWVMIFAAWNKVRIYTSPDLKEWEFASEFGEDKGTHGGVWECPDLFELPIEGTEEKRWVMLVSINPGGPNGGSATQYFVGDFDGKTFTLDDKFAGDVGKEDAYAPEGEVFANFDASYGTWKAEGEAVGTVPASGALAGQQAIEGFVGSGLVNTFVNGDKSTGKLTSPTFTIEKDYINFLIGGGKHPEETTINLVIEGQVMRRATGPNRESLDWEAWNVIDLKGEQAQIEIIDNHTGGWGHINVDQITFADEAARPVTENAVWLEYGRDNYAGVTWSDIPEADDRRIFLGWMSNWDYANQVPTEAWRSAMTLPRVMTLVETPEGLRVRSRVVEEIELIRAENKNQLSLNEETTFSGLAEVVLEWRMTDGNEEPFGLELSNSLGESYWVGYDPTSNSYFSDRTQSGKKDFRDNFAAEVHEAARMMDSKTVKMHVFIDVASAELFADEGMTVLTDIFFPNEDYKTMKVFGAAELVKAEVVELERVW